MTQEQYERLSTPFRGEKKEKILCAANRLLTRFCYVLYPLLLIWLGVQRDGRFWKALLVPAVSFILLSLVRSGLNFPRPYQVLDITPIIKKDTQGKSMPSRHVFSIFVIAATFLWILPPLGIFLMILGVLLAAVRVIGGVHFPRDVIVGAAVGLLAGLVGYVLIP